MSPQDRSAGRPDRRGARPAGDSRRGGGRPRDGAGGPRRSDAGRPTDREPDRERGGQRLTPKSPRRPEPAIADGVTGKELDRSVWTQLRTLSKENAEGVAQHLVMVALLLDTDLEGAQAHAETAVRRAGRVPAAREALGLVAYRQGDWAKALAEFRTVRRLSGSSHLLPLMVDAERALGRPDRALELASSPEARTLARDEKVELAIVVSGIRRDQGQLDAAAAGLRLAELDPRRRQAWSARLFYAYAEALLALGDRAAAREWFGYAVDADESLETDAAERVDELDGVEQLDLLGDEDDADERDARG
jgi:tetratricopeptide (TPR) repeat protein